jgi:PAS domain S-box-containing protein
MLEDRFVKKLEKDLMELHEHMIALEKIEIKRKRTRIPHREIEQEYMSFFQQAELGLAIVQNGVVVRANSPTANILGYSPEELMGTPFKQYIHPEDLPKVATYYNERLAGKEVPIIYRLRVKHKDGSDVEIETKMGVIPYNDQPADFAIICKLEK